MSGTNLGGTGLPPGVVLPFAGAGGNVPLGWVLCQGQAVSRTGFPELFAAIGTAHGAGDGSTTFNLPDMQGRIPVGVGTHTEVSTLGNNDGLAVGSRKVKHSHGRGTLTVDTDSRLLPTGFGGTIGSAVNNNDRPALTNAADAGRGSGGNTFTHNHSTSGVIGDTAGPLDSPAYVVLNYIIKT